MLDHRTQEWCEICERTGGVVYQIKVYEIHLHMPYQAPNGDSGQITMCTLLMEDFMRQCFCMKELGWQLV